MVSQGRWRACINCAGLFFNGHSTKGVCPADKFFFAPHATGEDLRTYRLDFATTTPNSPKTQRHWRWCPKCEGLFFDGNGTKGVCPASGRHSTEDAGEYRLRFGFVSPTPQNAFPGQFRWCSKCEGLFMELDFTKGRCPVGGSHSPNGGSGSGLYALKRGFNAPFEID